MLRKTWRNIHWLFCPSLPAEAPRPKARNNPCCGCNGLELTKFLRILSGRTLHDNVMAEEKFGSATLQKGTSILFFTLRDPHCETYLGSFFATILSLAVFHLRFSGFHE